MDIEIRAADEADWPAVLEQLERAGLPIDDLGAASRQDFLVGASAAAVVGAVAVQVFDTAGLLRSLVVAPDVQGAGLGRRLVVAIEHRAQRLGVRDLWLLTIDADGFFARLGYSRAARDAAPARIARTAEFADLCPDTAVAMQKRLLARSVGHR